MTSTSEPVSEWRAQLRGALDRRRGNGYRPPRYPAATDAAGVRYTHGWLSLHQACDCRYHLERGRSA